MSSRVSYEVIADAASTPARGVLTDPNSAQTDLGTYTVDNSGWLAVSADVSAAIAVGGTGRYQLDLWWQQPYNTGDPSYPPLQWRRVSLDHDGVLDFGQYPAGFAYTAGIQDGALGSPYLARLGSFDLHQYNAQSAAYDHVSGFMFPFPTFKLYFDLEVPTSIEMELPNAAGARTAVAFHPAIAY